MTRCAPAVAVDRPGGFDSEGSLCEDVWYRLVHHRWRVDGDYEYTGPSRIAVALSSGVRLLAYRYLESVFPPAAAAAWTGSLLS